MISPGKFKGGGGGAFIQAGVFIQQNMVALTIHKYGGFRCYDRFINVDVSKPSFSRCSMTSIIVFLWGFAILSVEYDIPRMLHFRPHMAMWNITYIFHSEADEDKLTSVS